MNKPTIQIPQVRSEQLSALVRAMHDNPASGTTVRLGDQPAVRLSVDVPLPAGTEGTPPHHVVTQALADWLGQQVDAEEIALDVAMTEDMRCENAIFQSREGRWEVQPSENCSALLAEVCDDKPLCRVEWYQDGGDPSVGIPGVAYWQVAELAPKSYGRELGGPEPDTALAYLLRREQQLRDLLAALGQHPLPSTVRKVVDTIQGES